MKKFIETITDIAIFFFELFVMLLMILVGITCIGLAGFWILGLFIK